jgi:oxalyl-CoA decarboxylase
MVQISGTGERHIVDPKQGDYENLDQLAAAPNRSRDAP